MYVAVKGGERAIENAHALLARERRGDPAVPELSLAQIAGQLRLAVDRVMNEGSLYDRELAALAVKQARGDLIEAIFLLRAFRTTLPRLGACEPIDTAGMAIARRISATFKDLPGGQVLGPTFDYTHRLLDPALMAQGGDGPSCPPRAPAAPAAAAMARVSDLLGDLVERPPAKDNDNDKGTDEGTDEGKDTRGDAAKAAHEAGGGGPADVTRDSLSFPLGRDARLQTLARADEGFLLSLGYSTQRGWGRTHPFAGEIRFGEVEVELFAPDVGFAVPIGRIEVTECETVNQFRGPAGEPPRFTRGYGMSFGQCERKALSMALVDRALRSGELGEAADAPAQDEEFVLSHCDNVQASGFVEHLKLPHYVDFQAELRLLRRLRAQFEGAGAAADDGAAS